MKLRIGDKVRFLNEVGEGTVTRFKDKETVFVDRNFFPAELSDYLEEYGLVEKGELSRNDTSFVQTEIESYLLNSELKGFESQYFNYIKRSDMK